MHLTNAFPPLFEQWCQAALLKLGRSGFLWGKTAARMHSLDGFTPAPKRRDSDQDLPIVVAVPHSKRCRPHQNLRVIRCRGFEPQDLTVVGGLPCSSIVRAFVEVAESCSWRSLVFAFEDIHRRGHHRWLAMRVQELIVQRPGLDRLVRLMSRRGPDATATDSAAEAWCEDILWTAGMRARRQHRVYVGGSYRKIDLAFPEQRVAVECDGREAHEFEKDRVRWAELISQGWMVVPFSWRQLKNEAYVRRVVRTALTQRGWRPTETAPAGSSPSAARAP